MTVQHSTAQHSTAHLTSAPHSTAPATHRTADQCLPPACCWRAKQTTSWRFNVPFRSCASAHTCARACVRACPSACRLIPRTSAPQTPIRDSCSEARDNEFYLESSFLDTPKETQAGVNAELGCGHGGEGKGVCMGRVRMLDKVRRMGHLQSHNVRASICSWTVTPMAFGPE